MGLTAAQLISLAYLALKHAPSKKSNYQDVEKKLQHSHAQNCCLAIRRPSKDNQVSQNWNSQSKQMKQYWGQQKLAVLLGIWNSHFSLPSNFSLLPLRTASYRLFRHLPLACKKLPWKFFPGHVVKGVGADRYWPCPASSCWSLFLSGR